MYFGSVLASVGNVIQMQRCPYCTNVGHGVHGDFRIETRPFPSGQPTSFPSLRDKERVVPRNVRTGRIKERVIEKKYGERKLRKARRCDLSQSSTRSVRVGQKVEPIASARPWEYLRCTYIAKRKFLIKKVRHESTPRLFRTILDHPTRLPPCPATSPFLHAPRNKLRSLRLRCLGRISNSGPS